MVFWDQMQLKKLLNTNSFIKPKKHIIHRLYRIFLWGNACTMALKVQLAISVIFLLCCGFYLCIRLVLFFKQAILTELVER